MASPLLFCHPLVRWRAPIGPLRLYIQRCSVPQPQLHFLKNHGRFTSISQTVFQAFDSRSIPAGFSQNLNERNMKKAVIESCQGSWQVGVARTGDGTLYFEGGWEEFVKYHNLKVGDFLVFKHLGRMVFHVNVYEPLGCEKAFPPPPAAAPSTSSPLFFLKSISETHSLPSKCYVTIPSEFVKAHGLGDRKKMILKVRFVGGKWPVELGTWQGGRRGAAISLRTAIRTRGWYKFYEDNRLKIGDCCKFVLKEVPDSKSKPVIMEVDIKHMVLGSSKAVVNFE
ncbi:hypothetical protein ACFXTI_017007 [Malus domestica]